MFLKLTVIGPGATFGAKQEISKILVPIPLIQLVEQDTDGCLVRIANNPQPLKVKESFDEICEKLGG